MHKPADDLPLGLMTDEMPRVYTFFADGYLIVPCTFHLVLALRPSPGDTARLHSQRDDQLGEQERLPPNSPTASQQASALHTH